MGLLDIFKLEQTRPVSGRHAKSVIRGSQPIAAAPRPAMRPGRPVPAHTASPLGRGVLSGVAYNGWVSFGASIEVAGLALPGGMLYVGRRCPSPDGSGRDPALIDPYLPVDFRNPDWCGSSVGYWPSYSAISAQARAAYLTWLAGGRSHPGVPISWVFLFFYGLERRVIVEAAKPGPAVRDLPAIRAEVRRLLGLYGEHGSFRSYATEFLSLIDARTAKTGPPGAAPPHTSNRWVVPYELREGLGRFAAASAPVPADWALSWVHFHPQIYPRTPAQRCRAEFEQLFRLRYEAHHGAGLRIRPDGTTLQHTYLAASSAIGQVVTAPGLPDVLQLTEPTDRLRALVEECTDALDAYSRYLGRHPDGGKDTLGATALLPPELLDDSSGSLARLRAWIEQRLGQRRQVLVDGADLITFWLGEESGAFSKTDAAALAQLLGTQGAGVEPDVRLGGQVLGPGPAVLFRIVPGQPTALSTTYAVATLMLHLAGAVMLADGQIPDARRAWLRSHLASSIRLAEPERVRLDAQLEWMLARQASLNGLAKRLAELDEAQRESIGCFLIRVAASDGVMSRPLVSALTKAFRLLGLPPASLYDRIHAAATNGAPAAEPVIVRHATGGAPGFVIPRQPADNEANATQVRQEQAPIAAPVRLDESAIAAKLAETAAVSALLGSIFAEDIPASETISSSRPNRPETSRSAIAGLDEPHSALLRTLSARDLWARAELEAACTAHGLLPDGALDTLNEAAYETAGDPVAEGEDPIRIDLNVAREMLS